MIRQHGVKTHVAKEDLKFDKSLKAIRNELRGDRGEFVFDPVDFKD